MRTTYLAPALLVIAAAACGQSTATTPGAGISGVVRIGPTCPAASKAHPCPLKPVNSERLRIRNSTTGRLIKTVTSDARGRFNADIPPGAYVVDPVNTGRYLRARSVHVNVSAGKIAHVRVVLDNGVR